MVLEDLDLNPYELIGLITGIVTALIVPLTVFLFKLKSKGESTEERVSELEEAHEKSIINLEKKIDAQRLDVKEERLELKQQIEQIKMDISKDIRSQLSSLKEKSETGDNIHKEFKESIEDQKRFFIDWIQRVEDLMRDGQIRRRSNRSSKQPV